VTAGPPAPPLRLLFWESTARCNLHCAHCRRVDAEAGPAGELSTDEALALVDSAAAMGSPVFVLSGGEPLLRDDWPAVARHAREKCLKAALATNGTLIDGPVAGRIAEAGFHRVAVSLDGADAATHDALRGRAGAFDAAVRGVRALREAGAAVQINSTLTRRSVDRLDALYDLTRRLGAEALHLFVLVPVGCGLELARADRLDATRVERALEWVCRRQAAGDLELKATCAPHHYRVASQWLAAHADDPGAAAVRAGLRGRGCLAGVGVVFVGHRGEVFPCGYLPVSCGNVREVPLGEIWRSSPVLTGLRDYDALTGRCGRCEYRAVCGGCRARAHAETGDLFGPDPLCDHTPSDAGA